MHMPERFCGGDSLRRDAISSVWTLYLLPLSVLGNDYTESSAIFQMRRRNVALVNLKLPRKVIESG